MYKIIAVLSLCAPAYAQPLDPLVEYRYCGAPHRAANHMIKRSNKVLVAFQAAHPCPSTGLKTGACVGWAMDHVIPLACGGCDAVYNLQWLPDAAKSCAEDHCKDRFERHINAAEPRITDTPNCVNKVLK